MILRVTRNPNCIDLEPTELREVSSPVEVSRLRIRWKSMAEGSDSLTEEYIWADIWGWSSAGGGSATLAYAQRVIDPDGNASTAGGRHQISGLLDRLPSSSGGHVLA